MLLTSKHKTFRAFTTVGGLIVAVVLAACCGHQTQTPDAQVRGGAEGEAFKLNRFQVEQGTEAAALEYYRTKVSPHLAFLTPETIEASSIKDLLEYFGYDDITATNLHRLSSGELMALSSPEDILATRFFAPKITDVADKPSTTPAGGFGWRKLVRLKAKTGSRAAGSGMEALLFLQNIFEVDITKDPFDPTRNVSKFNQAIAVRKQGPFDDSKHAVYFFAYRPLVKVDGDGKPLIDAGGNFQDDGKLALSLGATFDENDRDPETNLPPNFYFVPDSCAQCHGGDVVLGKANYLDTDHWFDRVTPDYGLTEEKYKQEDFTALAASPFGVLRDAKDGAAADQFQKAFDVIRKLNVEIQSQNSRLPEADNFQLGAVTRWLQLHEPAQFGTNHVPPYERGFGAEQWDRGDESHRKLLYYFNRYCYRCHSSVKYNVFDLEAVKTFKSRMRGRLLNITSARVWMPQDRIFPGLVRNGGSGQATGDLTEFLDLLSRLR